MTDGAMAYSPDGSVHWDRPTLTAAILDRFPAARVLDRGEKATFQIESGFQIFDFGTGMLATDGSAEQQLEFGAWVASLIPEDATGPVVLLNHDATVAAYLKRGMTPEDVEAAWHEEPPE